MVTSSVVSESCNSGRNLNALSLPANRIRVALMRSHQSLILAGQVPDENGSFMSVVHETVVGVRAALTGISKKTLPAFASGEQNIVEEYDDALREMSGDPKITEILKRQKENLLTKIAEMKKISA
jgi:Domain of unknown function (DUF2383)